MLEQRLVSLESESPVQKDHRPTVTKWKGEPMIRIQSMRATIVEILKASQARDVIKIGIIGEPDSGKTTQGETIAHLCHKISDELKGPKYAFRSFGKKEFLNMEETLNSLVPVNYVLQFKDLSFLAEKKLIEKVKNTVTEIRHLKEDVKIILIYDYHYTLGLDKYLRQSNYKYFTTVGSSETENMEKMFGGRYRDKIQQFQTMDTEILSKHKFSFRLSPKKWFSYSYKNPFIPMLFWNNSKLRFVVSPTREWIDSICHTCLEGKNASITSEIPVDKFCEESEYKFGKGHWLAAIKQELLMNGLDTFSPRVVQARRYYNKALQEKAISRDDIIQHYGLELTKTRLKKKLDGVLKDEG